MSILLSNHPGARKASNDSFFVRGYQPGFLRELTRENNSGFVIYSLLLLFGRSGNYFYYRLSLVLYTYFC